MNKNGYKKAIVLGLYKSQSRVYKLDEDSYSQIEYDLVNRETHQYRGHEKYEKEKLIFLEAMQELLAADIVKIEHSYYHLNYEIELKLFAEFEKIIEKLVC